MNDSTRKLLTEMIGECWHEWEDGRYKKGIDGYGCICIKCNRVVYTMHGDDILENRHFTTPDDQHAVMLAIVKAGKWYDFWYFCAQRADYMLQPSEPVAWLFLDPARFCELAGEWVEKERR